MPILRYFKNIYRRIALKRASVFVFLDVSNGFEAEKNRTAENYHTVCAPALRSGAPPGNRTRDTLLKRQVLCRLS